MHQCLKAINIASCTHTSQGMQTLSFWMASSLVYALKHRPHFCFPSSSNKSHLADPTLPLLFPCDREPCSHASIATLSRPSITPPLTLFRSVASLSGRSPTHRPWMAQYATNPKMLATVWRLLAKNPPPQVVASVTPRSLVRACIIRIGGIWLGGTRRDRRTGKSPQLHARAGGFLKRRHDRRQRPFQVSAALPWIAREGGAHAC